MHHNYKLVRLVAPVRAIPFECTWGEGGGGGG